MTVTGALYNLRHSQAGVGDWLNMFLGLLTVLLPAFLVSLVLPRRTRGVMTVGALKG